MYSNDPVRDAELNDQPTSDYDDKQDYLDGLDDEKEDEDKLEDDE